VGHVIKPEIILSLGAEDGSLTLYGVKLREEWSFLIKYEQINQTDLYLPETEHLSMFQNGFQHALNLLDRYPWETYIPRTIHPAFAEALLKEVESRIPLYHLRLTYWRRLIDRSSNLRQAPAFPIT
jgi:hypothetical protein